jgi:hypothetical protein
MHRHRQMSPQSAALRPEVKQSRGIRTVQPAPETLGYHSREEAGSGGASYRQAANASPLNREEPTPC